MIKNNFFRSILKSKLIGSCLLVATGFLMLFTATSAQAALAGPLSFGLDDNPFSPDPGSGAPPGIIPGFGAENPYGFLPVGHPIFPPGLAPSPSLGFLGPLGDGAILSPGPVTQHPGPAAPFPFGGFYIDSFSSNHAEETGNIQINFSVDRQSIGAAGDVVIQAGQSQQPGDIFRSTKSFTDPGSFVGMAGPAGFAGILPTVGIGGPGSNTLIIDEGLGDGGGIPGLGLTTGAGVIGVGVGLDGGIIGFGTHDNVDSFDFKVFDAPIGAGDTIFDTPHYFTLYPDEATAFGVPIASPADIFIAISGNFDAVTSTPYATAGSMGLAPFDPDSGLISPDSIDALVIWDFPPTLPPVGPLDPPFGVVDPGIDYALFSLSPGSAALATYGLSDADVFFTNFTGSFWTYASAADLGLIPAFSPGEIRPFQDFPIWDNIDALEINVVAAPDLSLSLLGGLVGLLMLVPMRKKLRAKGIL